VTTNVVPLRSFSEAEALEWLRRQPHSRVRASNIALSREWGWHRARVARRLRVWHQAGLVKRRGNVIVIANTGVPNVAANVAPAATPAASVTASPWPRISGAILAATALGLAGVGLILNARFAASFGQTAEAATLLAAIGLAIDMLAVVLPTAAAQLWRRRNQVTASAAWVIWVLAVVMTLLAAVGFAATHIGDAVAGRTKVATESAALSATLDRLRTERARIAETRAVATLEAEIQLAQPIAAAVWRQTVGCTDVTRPQSGEACRTVLRLREAMGAARRRDALDRELADAEARLARLPAITTGDPQAIMAADLFAWLTAGGVSLTPHDIHRARITGLTITPSLAGILLMLAFVLWMPRQPQTG
jgi:hypothetical protein